MARSLSMDLRERVVRAVDEGASRREAAARFGVSAASAVRWCALARDRGDASPLREASFVFGWENARHCGVHRRLNLDVGRLRRAS